MAKFIKYGKQIVSLQNVLEVNLHEDESQHTSYGKKYTDKHYTIRIDYTNGKSVFIKTPDNEAKQALNLLDVIFDELNAD